MQVGRWWIPAALVLGAISCNGHVGDPCIPEDEFSRDFSGFDVSEVNVESRSFQCETRMCLVNHFEGRVSCPYGTTDGSKCALPGTDGKRSEERVGVQVPAQLVDRRPDDAVYCSCRCAGPDPDGHYCECPSGYECAPLVPDLDTGQGQQELVGSYCVKQGTRADNPNSLANGPRCNPERLDCGPAH